MNETPLQKASHVVFSNDGTKISYLSVGGGPWVIVIPGVLSMAADYATFARALSEHFTVHIIERRGRGESGPQGDDYSIVKECEDVLALQAETGGSLLVGHSYGLVALGGSQLPAIDKCRHLHRRNNPPGLSGQCFPLRKVRRDPIRSSGLASGKTKDAA